MKRWAMVLLAVCVWHGQAQAQTQYAFSAGPSAWGTWDGTGLIGMAAQVEYQGLALEALVGIGTNRVQGWGLWPRVYLEGTSSTAEPALLDTLRFFGELPLVQLSETQISVDPDRGLVKQVYTWQFMGLGLGAEYLQGDRSLRASAGIGVNGGQCAACGMQAYVAVHIGFSF